MDNDGVVDEYLEPSKSAIYSIDHDGKIFVGTMPIVSLSSLQNQIVDEGETEDRSFVAWDYSMLSPGYIGSQMFGRDGGGTIGALDGGVFKSMDINGNGLTDHINFNSGKVYFNLGNGKYYTDNFNGRMHFADFNGDGRVDYVLYDGNELSLNITLPEGGTKKQKIISGYSCTNVWTRDVDRDNDVDIVLSLESNQKFIVVLENVGDGSFRRRENVINNLEENSKFKACYDYDNDGNYEVITDKNKAYRLNGYTLDTTPIEIAPKDATIFVNPADGATYYGNYFVHYNSMRASYSKVDVNVNSRPEAPNEAPGIIYESSTGLIKITWTPGSDKETPATDLTYSIRIGSASGEDDILSAYAAPDGTRWQATEGNSSGMTSRIIDTSRWPVGKYFIAVQSVDGNFCGSEFSSEAVFEKKEPSTDFALDYQPNFGVYTPLKIRLKSVIESCNEYEWSFDGGKEVARSEDGKEIYVIYDTPGEKNESLTVISADGVASRTVTHSLEVFPTSVKPGELKMDFGEWNPEDDNACFSAVFDMDEDGIAEAYSARWTSKFLKGDKNGVYRPIERMFNSHSYVGKFRDISVATIDMNGDGLCDIVSPDFESRYSKLYYGYNLGDMDMDFDFESGNGLNNLYVEEWMDFDNDGAYDVFGRSEMWRNDGTYKNFTTKTLRLNVKNVFADCNGDGLIDVIMGNTIYYNNGDFTFSNPTDLEGIPDNYSGTYVYAARDFDNNGAIDYLFYNSGQSNTLCILWDDGKISDLGISSYSLLRDINNNGFLDILDDTYVLTFLPGRTWNKYNIDVSKDVDETQYEQFGRCFEASNGKTYAISESYQKGYYSSTLPNVMSVNIPNQAPLPPTNIRHTQNMRFVVLEWDHSLDKETPGPQMQYNLSIKRKDASGPGSYLFSPANSGKNGVPVPSNKPLIRGNVFSIPVANIPAGAYEVKIQGVDAFGKQSDFSEIYDLVVRESASIDMQATGEVNVPVDIKVLVNYDATVNFDGAREIEYSSGVHTVVWDSPGTKIVTVNNYSSRIVIQEAPDGSFDLPSEARCGDRINLHGKLMDQGEWSVFENVWGEGKWVQKQVNILEPNKYFDFEIISSTEALVVPKTDGNSSFSHLVSSRFSTQEYKGIINCTKENSADMGPSAPVIDYVTADATTGKYKIQWTNPEKIRPEATAINVYKEGSVAGTYVFLERLSLTTTEYIDRSSNPDVMAARYLLTYELTYGESRDSKVHQPVHAMINRGAGSSWNIIWGRYEGATIPQYRILRGATPESLEVIAEISGNLTSYTDFTAPASGSLYYAVESVLESESMRAPSVTRAPSATNPRSNVIAAAGNNIIFAQNINILSDSGNKIEYNGESAVGIQLRAVINPTGATFGRVNWIVTYGDDIVCVDQSGYVIATGVDNGQATVRAQSIDGSGVYDEFDIYVNGVSAIYSPIVDNCSSSISVYPSPAINEVNITGLTQGCDIFVFSLGGAIIFSTSDWNGGDTINIDCSSWPSGTYIARVQNKVDNTHLVRKFIKL